MPYRSTEAARENKRNYYRDHREKLIAQARARRKFQPSKSPQERRAARLRKKYDLTPEMFADMLAAQNGRCAMPDCRLPDPGGRHGQWQVDHDHETGRVRGLLCTACNVRLGQYERLKVRAAAFETYLGWLQ